jgi:AbiTii
MSLLTEIRDAAVDAKTVAVALRKAKILAARLKNEPFKTWVDRELNGYPKDKESLPSYRVVNAPAVGDFSGPFGSGLRNFPIPSTCLPENLRDYARRAFIFSGVGELEAFIETAGSGGLSLPWPADLTVFVGTEIVQDMNCLSARQEIPKAVFISIVEAVRSKLIDFVLEIEIADPSAGEAEAGATPLAPEKVSQIVHNTIYNYGGSANVASGSSHVTQNASANIRKNDMRDLVDYLRSIDITDGDLQDLKAALESEVRRPERGRWGPKVSGWIGRMVSKAASGAWRISVEAAPELITKALSSYYGWS